MARLHVLPEPLRMTDQPDQKPSDLSFDRAIPVTPVSLGGSGGGTEMTCASCRRAITGTYHTVNGEPICENCRVILGNATSSPTAPALLVKAIIYGFGATLAGAFIYWAVIRFANLEIGLVAILSGWMIGKALRAGAGGRGGLALQVIGAALVYLSVAMAYFPFVYSAGSGSGEPLSLLVIVALLSPVRSVFSSGSGGIISALIIGFGMMQAWQQAKPHAVVFEGPFRVGGAAA